MINIFASQTHANPMQTQPRDFVVRTDRHAEILNFLYE
jgi:hypothetical protein